MKLRRKNIIPVGLIKKKNGAILQKFELNETYRYRLWVSNVPKTKLKKAFLDGNCWRGGGTIKI